VQGTDVGQGSLGSSSIKRSGYSRISNPTDEVLERRVAALKKGDRGAKRQHWTGRVALRGAECTIRKQYRLSTAALRHHSYSVRSPLPSLGVTVRFAERHDAAAIELLSARRSRFRGLRRLSDCCMHKLRHQLRILDRGWRQHHDQRAHLSRRSPAPHPDPRRQ
jgi:hypothetical protein